MRTIHNKREHHYKLLEVSVSSLFFGLVLHTQHISMDSKKCFNTQFGTILDHLLIFYLFVLMQPGHEELALFCVLQTLKHISTALFSRIFYCQQASFAKSLFYVKWIFCDICQHFLCQKSRTFIILTAQQLTINHATFVFFAGTKERIGYYSSRISSKKQLGSVTICSKERTIFENICQTYRRG